jgi:hypothetical protein
MIMFAVNFVDHRQQFVSVHLVVFYYSAVHWWHYSVFIYSTMVIIGGQWNRRYK